MGLVFLELPRTFLEPYPYELLSRHKPMNAKCKIYSQKMHNKNAYLQAANVRNAYAQNFPQGVQFLLITLDACGPP